ncbi:MAG: alpha,6-mannosyltransferase [Candidatus Sumerlaeota bacterium]|nr:alpha,6-mannosyltransferase [Candidatus Sumerlaeota bacterium]
MDSSNVFSTPHRQTIALAAPLAGLAVLGGGLVWLSARFGFSVPIEEKPVEAVVLLLCAMGLCFLLLARRLLACGLTRSWLAVGIGLGLALRLAMLFSQPILETDYYRYLWDGAVVATGTNPYRPIPEQVLEVQGPLTPLALESGVVAARINHPQLRTVYPPVAQGFFGLSHLIAPWSLLGWRLVLLVADGVTLALLIQLLRSAQLPLRFSLLYWLNPVVLKEIHNAAHMDVLLVPFLLGALLLAHRGRLMTAVLCLVGAAGIKVWPLLLLPLLLRAADVSRGRKVGAVCFAGALAAVLYLPVAFAGLNETSGFTAYASRWEMNNSLSLLLLALGRWVEGAFLPAVSARAFAVGASAILLGTALLIALRKPVGGVDDLAGRALALAAALFLLSPTQFPWYSLWFLPLLAIRPHIGLLFYALTLPLYYLRFRYAGEGIAPLFDNGVVWIEHGPVLLLLAAAKWKPVWIPAHPGPLSALPSARQSSCA